MNPHRITLKYLGWCPGIDNVARWIPDKEYSDRRVAAVSVTVLIALFGFSFIYSLTRVRPSYSWDIEFTEAAYDDAKEMYVVTKYADTDGIYNVTIWADSEVGDTCLIWMLGPGSIHNLMQDWKITDGLIQGPHAPFGLRYNDEWLFFTSHSWEIYSNLRDQKVHIRIQYMRERNAMDPY